MGKTKKWVINFPPLWEANRNKEPYKEIMDYYDRVLEELNNGTRVSVVTIPLEGFCLREVEV